MSHFSRPGALIGALLMIGVFSSYFSFTRCSQHYSSAPVPATAFMSVNGRHIRLKEEFKNRVPASFCTQNDSYTCMKRVFSSTSEHEASSLISQECGSLSNSLRICPYVQTFQFNTSTAQKNCAGCEENYEYLEYSCHLKIANEDGVYPILAIKPTLSDSLYELHQFCGIIARTEDHLHP